MKKITRRRLRDTELIKRRLDMYRDNWRTVPISNAPHPKRKIEQKRGPKPKNQQTDKEQVEKKPRKQKATSGTTAAAAVMSISGDPLPNFGQMQHFK